MAQGQLAITPRECDATLGDDWSMAFTLWDAGAVKNVSTASEINAAVQDLGSNRVISSTACSASATGASWATGVVVLPFTSAQTANLRAGEYLIEIQTTLGGAKTTWPLVPVFIQNGVIP